MASNCPSTYGFQCYKVHCQCAFFFSLKLMISLSEIINSEILLRYAQICVFLTNFHFTKWDEPFQPTVSVLSSIQLKLSPIFVSMVPHIFAL